jgi:hypothetical protein
MQEEGAALSQATRSRVEIQITKVRNAAWMTIYRTILFDPSVMSKLANDIFVNFEA